MARWPSLRYADCAELFDGLDVAAILDGRLARAVPGAHVVAGHLVDCLVVPGWCQVAQAYAGLLVVDAGERRRCVGLRRELCGSASRCHCLVPPECFVIRRLT